MCLIALKIITRKPGEREETGKKPMQFCLYTQVEFASMQEQVEMKFPDLDTIRNVYQSVADFLHIPSGAGEGNTYDFDLGRFCSNFGIDRTTAINALQISKAKVIVP